MNFITHQPDHIILRLHVQPGAKKSEMVGIHGDRLKVRLKAPPVDGKANAELIRFIAEFFNLKLKDVEIISGERSRQKDVRIPKISVEIASFSGSMGCPVTKKL